MNLSELITKLQKIQEESGNLLVSLFDTEFDCYRELTEAEVVMATCKTNGRRKVVLLDHSYDEW